MQLSDTSIPTMHWVEMFLWNTELSKCVVDISHNYFGVASVDVTKGKIFLL